MRDAFERLLRRVPQLFSQEPKSRNPSSKKRLQSHIYRLARHTMELAIINGTLVWHHLCYSSAQQTRTVVRISSATCRLTCFVCLMLLGVIALKILPSYEAENFAVFLIAYCCKVGCSEDKRSKNAMTGKKTFSSIDGSLLRDVNLCKLRKKQIIDCDDSIWLGGMSEQRAKEN